jgi:two-component system, cell cycle response regulator DivK
MRGPLAPALRPPLVRRLPRPVSMRPLALVIDDSDDTREMFAVMLRLEGFAVEGAGDGAEGFQKAVELLPNIIITDLVMPIVDGWETIRRLRADDRTRRIPILACTGQKAPSGTHDSGADVLLAKPCPPNTLLLEVRQLLRRGAAA